MTEREPTTGDAYKLMCEPSNIKDSNADAILREKFGEKENQQADDVHPNNVTDRFKSYCSCPSIDGYVVKKGSKEVYELRKSND